MFYDEYATYDLVRGVYHYFCATYGFFYGVYGAVRGIFKIVHGVFRIFLPPQWVEVRRGLHSAPNTAISRYNTITIEVRK